METKSALPHRHNLYQRHPFIKTTSTGKAHRLHQEQSINIAGYQYNLGCDAIIYLCLLVLDRMSVSHRFIGILGEKLSEQVRLAKSGATERKLALQKASLWEGIANKMVSLENTLPYRIDSPSFTIENLKKRGTLSATEITGWKGKVRQLYGGSSSAFQSFERLSYSHVTALIKEESRKGRDQASPELTDINKMQMQASEADCSTLTQLFYTLLSSFKNMLMTTGRPA